MRRYRTEKLYKYEQFESRHSQTIIKIAMPTNGDDIQNEYSIPNAIIFRTV